MAFKVIEDIKVNGVVGKIFDQYIYSFNMNIGYSESPTTMVINAVSEEDFSDTAPLALDKAFTIQIGPKIYKEMSLFSSEESHEVGKRITTYTFIDPSFLLDKIYIGLVDRQKSGGSTKEYKLKFPVSCEVCGAVEAFELYYYNERRALKNEKFLNINKNGGYIILGTEEFTITQCDLPDIRYNFTDLIEALKQQSELIFDLPIDKNSNYRQSYVGTLREVLSSWCADFGYTFYFDLDEGVVKFIDLTSPILTQTISKIKTVLTANRGKDVSFDDTPPYISSYAAKKTLENTYDQNHISIYKKNSRNRSSSTKYYKNTTFLPVTLKNIVGASDTNYERSLNGLYESIAINKYFPNLRFAYNYSKENYKALGLQKLKPALMTFENFNQALKDIAAVNLSDKIFEAMNNYWGSADLNYNIVAYNSDFESDIIQWESDLGNNFIGKNYYRELAKNDGPDRDTLEAKVCYSNFSLDRTVSTEPSSNEIKDGAYPHSNLIKSNNYSRLPDKSRVFQRQDAVWDVDEESIQDYIKNNSDLLLRFQPEYIPFDDQMFDLFKFGAQGLYADQDPVKANAITSFFTSLENSKISLMAYPNTTALSSKITFGTLSNAGQNQKESVYGSESTGGGTNDECSLRCERDPMDAYCPSCDTQNTIKPSTGLATRKAKSFSFIIEGRTFPLIFPSEEEYYAYFFIDNNIKYTVPKSVQIFGDLIENLNENTMSLNVIQTDIANDIDPFIDKDGNTIIEAPTLIGDGSSAEMDFISITPSAIHEFYHKRLSYSINYENEIVSCRIIGLDFGALEEYLSPSRGLNSFQITSSENGVFTDLQFSTRPIKLPKEESLFNNTFIKTNTLGSVKNFNS